MATDLVHAPCFQAVRSIAGLLSAIAEPAAMTEANYARSLGVSLGLGDKLQLYWTATTSDPADTVDLEIYVLDGGANAPSSPWIFLANVTGLAPHTLVVVPAVRSALLLVRVASVAADVASSGLVVRAAVA